MRVAGIDGRQRGWVVATVEVAPGPRLLSLEFVAPFRQAIADPSLSVVAIDMPIGLPEDGPRACDIAARRLLRPHGSRVFPTPLRVCLDHADDYAAACTTSTRASGKALSRQAWNLLPAMAEVDELADDDRLFECHPEIAFALLHGHPIAEAKRTPQGRALRLAALRQWLPDLGDPAFGDDGLDALACAWTAARIAAGTALILPAGEIPRDAQGRPMRICA